MAGAPDCLPQLLPTSVSSEKCVKRRLLSEMLLLYTISQFFLFFFALLTPWLFLYDLIGLMGDYRCKMVGWQTSGLLNSVKDSLSDAVNLILPRLLMDATSEL